MVKKYSKRKLAQAYLRIRAAKSEREAIQALAAQLIVQRLTNQVELISQEIAREILLQQRELQVTVTSARKLSATLVREIGELLRKLSGAERVMVAEQQDESVQGGFVATSSVGQLDTTVQSRLRQLVV